MLRRRASFVKMVGLHSGASLVYDNHVILRALKDLKVILKDVPFILWELSIEMTKASMTGGASFLGVAWKLLLKTFKLAIDYIAFDWLNIRHWTLDWIKTLLKLVDPPGERVVLQLYNLTTQELLLGYNTTSGNDISVFPYGIYSSENDSAIMILSRSTADYNFTVLAQANSSVLPYTLVTWDCIENYTITTGGFLEPNQTSSSMMKMENGALKMSYLKVEANFSDFTPHIGDEVIVNINVTDNLEHPIEGANTTIVVGDQFVLAEDLGNGKYQGTLDTSSMLGFYNVTIFTAEPPDGHLQGISTYPLKVGAVDIAVTNVVCSKTVVGQDYLMSVNVTVANEGNLNETFYVTVYANSTVIQRQAVLKLSGGSSAAISLTWNTTDVSYGNYTICAVADIIPGEIDTADNTLSGGVILVTIPGDCNGDRTVDIFDIGAISSHWYPGPPVGPSGYHANADINNDVAVDIFDIGITSAHWGESW